jgi:TRAP-type C4-dicarboxylate transport system permease small subunit
LDKLIDAGVAEAKEAGYADDLRDFRWRGHGPEDWAGLVLLWVLAVLVFVQFFSRYALNDSVAWTEEVARYGLIVLVFVGSAGAVKRGTHIRVEALEQVLPGPARRVLWAFQDLCRLGFWGFGAWVSFDLADRMGVMPMDSLDASLAWVYWPVFAGFAMMTLREAAWVWRRWRHGDAPSHQEVVA